MRLVIDGPPRTKKTSNRIVTRKRDGRQFVIPSSANEAWTKSAVKQLLVQSYAPPIRTPVTMRATIYREKNLGDLIGYLQAIADALEEAGVVTNDRLIMAFDGSRMLKDAARPRVEIELLPLVETT
jgi:Holliday junction resolvase RusA-like endonuclease